MANTNERTPQSVAQEIEIDGVARVVMELRYDDVEKRDRIVLLASDKNGHTVKQILIIPQVSGLDGAHLLRMVET